MKNIIQANQKFILIIVGLLCVHISQAQSDEKRNKKLENETQELLRSAEDQLGENDFSAAEASYREAIAKSPENVTAKYNMANMYYSKEKASQAAGRYKQAASVAETKEAKHEVFHNLGNSYMKQKKYQEAVDSYKNALRNIPSDEETRYNLALAKKMLEQQKKDGGGDDDKKDQDKKQDDKNKDKKGDKGDQEKDKNEGDKKEDQGGDNKEDQQKEPEKPDDKGKPKDQKDKQDEKGDKKPQEQQQPQPGQLSPQQIKSLLEAMNNEEKKVQDKINAQKAKGVKTRTEKDW